MQRCFYMLLYVGVLSLILTTHCTAETCLNWMYSPTSFNVSLDGARGAYDSHRSVSVIFGGTYDAIVREFDGSSMVEIPVKGPGARTQHAMVYDANRQVVVLFGGKAVGTNQLLGGTWEWDGTLWQLKHSPSPSPRYGHAMAFDSSLGKVVLFGGNDGTGDLDDTWVWDGSSWSRLLVDGPSRRLGHAMTYDNQRTRIVLFGGQTSGSTNNETWEFDGLQWISRSIGGPSARRWHEMAYDVDRHLVMMYRGDNPSDGIWAWDGVTWQASSGGAQPAAGYQGYVFVYDHARHYVSLVQPWGEVWTFGIGNLFVGGSPPSDTIVVEHQATMLRFDLELYSPMSCSSSGPAQVQWRHNGVPIPEGGRFIGTQTNALGVFPAQLADAGEYDVVVTRPCGELITLPVTLTVTPAIAEPCFARPDVNENGMVDFADITSVLANWGQSCGAPRRGE